MRYRECACARFQVLLLGKGGYTVYTGPADEAKDYFECDTPRHSALTPLRGRHRLPLSSPR